LVCRRICYGTDVIDCRNVKIEYCRVNINLITINYQTLSQKLEIS
jgi:hypothetical protein